MQDITHALTGTGGYRTAEDLAVGPADRLLGRLDAWLYVRVFREVVRANLLARRGRYDTEAWYKNSQDILRVFELCGARVVVEGAGVLDRETPAVIVANHMSMLETFLLPGLVAPFRGLSFVVKRTLMTYPLFGRVLRATSAIAVSRGNPREDLKTVMTRGREALEAGRFVLIFPQSTRLVRFDPTHFNSLGSKLARRAGVPVIPLALKTDFWGIGRLVRDFGPIDRTKRVRFRFGTPLRVADGHRQVHDQVVRFIAESLTEWGGEVAAAGGAGVVE
jgi:1-acyl-sn-glycerol-3-phosphate acyltransferase